MGMLARLHAVSALDYLYDHVWIMDFRAQSRTIEVYDRIGLDINTKSGR